MFVSKAHLPFPNASGRPWDCFLDFAMTAVNGGLQLLRVPCPPQHHSSCSTVPPPPCSQAGAGACLVLCTMKTPTHPAMDSAKVTHQPSFYSVSPASLSTSCTQRLGMKNKTLSRGPRSWPYTGYFHLFRAVHRNTCIGDERRAMGKKKLENS